MDDRSRLTYSEVHDDESFATTIAFWHRAAAFYASHGITVRFTRPFRPQTNGKVKRFHRTLRDEWAYGKTYRSENTRRKALTSWLHIYNHHRPHTALGGKPPITRVTNLPGQNN